LPFHCISYTVYLRFVKRFDCFSGFLATTLLKVLRLSNGSTSASRPVLLLRGTHTPCGYAARANSEGAKFRFAFSLVGLFATIRLTPLHFHTCRSYFDPIKDTLLFAPQP
jgi:hypothetical protein